MHGRLGHADRFGSAAARLRRPLALRLRPRRTCRCRPVRRHGERRSWPCGPSVALERVAVVGWPPRLRARRRQPRRHRAAGRRRARELRPSARRHCDCDRAFRPSRRNTESVLTVRRSGLRELAVAGVTALRHRAAMVPGQQRDDLDLFRLEAAQVAVLDQVIRMLVVTLVADVVADVVQQRGVLQPLAFTVAQTVDAPSSGRRASSARRVTCLECSASQLQRSASSIADRRRTSG